MAMLLGGCATTGTNHGGVGQVICNHATEARLALELAMTQTDLIIDPVKQELARSAIRVSMAALERCP